MARPKLNEFVATDAYPGYAFMVSDKRELSLRSPDGDVYRLGVVPSGDVPHNVAMAIRAFMDSKPADTDLSAPEPAVEVLPEPVSLVRTEAKPVPAKRGPGRPKGSKNRR